MRHCARMILVAAGLSLASSGAADPPATAPATATTRPAAGTTSGFAPIAYYEEFCSRCHGQFGTGYLSDMGKRLTDDALRQVIKDMAEGPAAAPLDDAQLAAEVAYHRSFIAGTPFVARVTVTNGEQSGEVTAGSTLSAEVNGKLAPAAVDGHTWKLPSSAASPRLIVERDGQRTTLESGVSFSHAEPMR